MNMKRQKTLITRSRHLWKAVKTCSKSRVIGIDTESNSFWAYQEQVCIIQLIAEESIFLIDSIALEDLSPLGEVFHDPGIIKIFHGADYDLRCLRRDYALRPAPIFDTMIAAMLLGYPALGLGALVKQHFGVDLPKTNALTRYDWARRPLPEEHLEYLVNDVHYLPQLREILLEELTQKDLVQECEWEFRQLEQIGRRQPIIEPEDLFSIKGAKQLEDKERAVLQHLQHYRDRVARHRDVPRFKVLSNTNLIEIARACPANAQQLKGVNGLSERLFRQHSKRLLEAIHAGIEDYRTGKIPALPERKPLRRGPVLNNELETRLKQWRTAEAERRGIAPQAVLPTSCLKDIARSSHLDELALSQIPGMIPKRLERYAGEILQIAHSLKQSSQDKKKEGAERS